MIDRIGDAIFNNLGKVVVILIALIVVMTLLLMANNQAMYERCEQMGGTMYTATKTSTGTFVSSGGQINTTLVSSTTYFCVSEEGGILFIE